MDEKLIYKNDFENADGLSCDGNGKWWVSDSRLYIDDSETDKSGMTIWIREEMPKDIRIVFNAMVVPPRMANNINFFFAAKTIDGGYIPDAGFRGGYGQYHEEADLHILTCTGNNPEMGGGPGWSRLRRDPGFILLSEDADFETLIEVPYKIEIIKNGDKITAMANDKILHDIVVDEPLDGGCIGFRTWKTKVYFEDISVYSIG